MLARTLHDLSPIARLSNWLDRWLLPVALLLARLLMARIFFYSGLTKLNSWTNTLFLFEYEYKVPVLPVEVAAYLAATLELTLPVLLVAGLATRPAALLLLGMTTVIELFVYPGTMEHYYWMVILTVLVAAGGGTLSIDRLVVRRLGP